GASPARMLAVRVGAGLRLVGRSAGGMGSACRNGRVGGLFSRESPSHSSGSGGTPPPIVSCARASILKDLVEVSIVMPPTAAPALTNRRLPRLGPLRAFFRSLDITPTPPHRL